MRTIFMLSFYLVSQVALSQINFEKIITRGTFEQAHSIIQTSDGGYAFVGCQDFTSGINNTWLVKTNATGDTLWSRLYKGMVSVSNLDRKIVETSDGGLTFIAIRNKSILFHTSMNGDSAWQKVIDPVAGEIGRAHV